MGATRRADGALSSDRVDGPFSPRESVLLRMLSRIVPRYGVCCVYTPDGMTVDNWREGVAQFEEHAVESRGDVSENGTRPSLRRDGSLGSLGSLSAGNSGKMGNSGKGRIFFSP